MTCALMWKTAKEFETHFFREMIRERCFVCLFFFFSYVLFVPQYVAFLDLIYCRVVGYCSKFWYLCFRINIAGLARCSSPKKIHGY